MTVEDNITYGLALAGVGRRERTRRATELLKMIGIERFRFSFPHQISEGMRQRVAIAQALAVDPDLLLMDEPFSALDEQTKLVLQDDVLDIWERTRKTVVLITHSIDEALVMADRVVVFTPTGTDQGDRAGRLSEATEFPERPLGSAIWRAIPGDLVHAAGGCPGARDGERAVSRRYWEVLLSISGPVALLAIWEILSRSGLIDSRFWPAPSSLIDTLWVQIESGALWTNIRISMVRVLLGFVIAAVPGVVLGLAMGLYWPIRVFLMPVATALYAIPKLAVLPLILIVFGTGESGKLAIIVVSIFFLIVLNTMSGVMAIDAVFRDVAQNLGASRWQLFTTVALPGALPAIFTGFRLALGFALLVIVGTEFLDGNKRDPNGLGWYIIRSWNLLKIEDLFVGLIVVGLVAWIVNVVLDFIERRLLPWQPDGRRP